MTMRLRRLSGRRKLRIVHVRLARIDRKIEAFEKVGWLRRLGVVRQTQPVFAAGDRNHWPGRVLGEEVLETDAEYHGDPQQGRQGWEQLIALDLRQQGG